MFSFSRPRRQVLSAERAVRAARATFEQRLPNPTGHVGATHPFSGCQCPARNKKQCPTWAHYAEDKMLREFAVSVHEQLSRHDGALRTLGVPDPAAQLELLAAANLLMDLHLAEQLADAQQRAVHESALVLGLYDDHPMCVAAGKALVAARQARAEALRALRARVDVTVGAAEQLVLLQGQSAAVDRIVAAQQALAGFQAGTEEGSARVQELIAGLAAGAARYEAFTADLTVVNATAHTQMCILIGRHHLTLTH